MSEETPLDFEGISHVAMIMDGNGRWARRQGQVRTDGHRAGVDSVREVVTECARGGLSWLSLYALSTENYVERPEPEVAVLMDLLERFMIDERPTLMDNRVRLMALGRIDQLPARVQKAIADTEALTRGNDGMRLAVCLNYGGRAEILDAVKQIGREVAIRSLDPEGLTEDDLRARLYAPHMPDVDLLVRTAGEQRISNFLLWQVSYGEIHTTEVCWPDFRRHDLVAALADYRSRARRFGGLLEDERA